MIPTKEIVIYPKTGKLVGLSVLSLVFVVLGAVFILAGLAEDETSIVLVVIGAVSVLFLGDACYT
ncbi:hypothetical protein N6H14_15595 [Paenibacillus sp. CC-CFT747]|nr:hypothetical protein N6H14_15595 [Paenibacillus sp. CC-CFT747]